MQDQAASASSSAQAAYQTITEKIIDTWSESQLKDFCDKNGIQGLFHRCIVESVAPALLTHCR